MPSASNSGSASSPAVPGGGSSSGAFHGASASSAAFAAFSAALKKKLEMRRVPRLIYRIDKSLKREAEVLSAINEARRRDDELKQNRTDGESGSIRSESTEDDIS